MDEILKALPVPAGILGMITLVVLALIKDRRQDKDSVPIQQQEIITGLKAQVAESETKNNALQKEVDEEIRKRRTAEGEAHAYKLVNDELVGKVDNLTQKVESLERRINELSGNGKPPE